MIRHAACFLSIVLFSSSLTLTACAPEASDNNVIIGDASEDASIPSTPLDPAEGTKVWTIAVEGMSCEIMCPPHVHDAIVELDGIQEVHVSQPDGLAWIRVPEDTELTVEDVVEAVNGTDSFSATVPGTQS